MRAVKTNLTISLIILGLITALFVATTVAYFSDTKKMTNVITAGDVKITLSEAAVKRDSAGNLIEDPTADRIYGDSGNRVHDYGRIYPSLSIHKDPTIKNVGSDEAWVAFKLTFNDGVGDIRKIMGYPTGDHLDPHMLFTGKLFDEPLERGMWNGFPTALYNENFALVQVGRPEQDKYEIYIFMLKPLKSGYSVTVFDTMTIPEEWTSEEMKELTNFSIDVEAFGVQAFNLDSCFTAMTSALPKYFNFS